MSTTKTATKTKTIANNSNSTMLEDRKRHISQYRATTSRFLYEIGTSFAAYAALLIFHGPDTLLKLYGLKFWLIAPFVHMRLFMIFHDCGHGSFAPSPKVNKWLHRLLSVLLMTPIRWRESHRRHHQHLGKLDNELNFQWNDTVYFTKREFDNLRPVVLKKVLEWIRYPPIYFPLAAFYEWNIRHRMPVLDTTSGYTTADNFLNTISILIYAGLVILWKGNVHLMVDMFISGMVAQTFGLTLFHTQHSFEDGYRVTEKEWDLVDAAFQGSSCTLFPWFLRWSTMGIGYHHIHHYDPRVPGYLLQECHEKGDPNFWKGVTVIDTMPEFWKHLWTTVYDEDQQKFVYYSSSN